MKYCLTAGTRLGIKYNGKKYVMPIGFNVTNILYESKDKLEFLFTNSHQGTLKLVSVDR